MNKTHEICIEFKDRNLFESQNDDDSFNLTIKSEPEGVFETINTNILARSIALIWNQIRYFTNRLTDKTVSIFHN